MIIKKFVGKTETEATAAAKKELGENLVIMSVKFVKKPGLFSVFRKKQVEVTAALEDDEEPIRQIRRIAEAQVAAQEKVQAAKKEAGTEGKEASHKESGFSIRVDDSTPVSSHEKKQAVATAAIKEAGLRTGIASEQASEKSEKTEKSENKTRQDSASIEKKLDNLQNLIENQLKEKKADSEAEERTSETESSSAQKSASSNISKEEELSEQEKEIDRFLKLLYNTMIDNEIDERYVNEIIGDAQKNKKPGANMDFILGTIYQKMILKFGKSEGIGPSQNGPKLVFFIGPTGVGKTTTIAKIASSYSINEKKKVALLTTDTYRIAATDQLRVYAGILQVPFKVIYTPEDLVQAVSDFASCDYIFIDSAGHSHKNDELLSKQKEYLEIVSEDYESQIFLVLSATTKYKDLLKIAENYKEISDFQLIFTKLDETSEYGNLYNIRCATNVPIAYVTYGQNVPDDIEAFAVQKTVKQLLGGKGGLV